MDKHLRKAALLAKVKLLNGDSGNPDADAILDFAVDKVVGDVSNYTHLPVAELPEELDDPIVGVCLQFVTTHQLLVPIEDQVSDVASLSEGDASMTFKTPAQAYSELVAVNTLTDQYVMQLNQFRVVKR